MILSTKQINDLLKTIEHYTNVFIAKYIGTDYLTKEEIQSLEKVGINPKKLYSASQDILKQSFYFGLISDAMKDDAQKITFDDLKNHFIKGEHIPLSEVEEYILDSIKKQSLKDIKANGQRIFNDVNNIISEKEKNKRSAYEKVIRKEVELGLLRKQTIGEIAREIARKTGDWSRDFTKSVEYTSHLAMSEGRISAIERKGGKKVYVSVFNGACKHCIRLYLTKGLGSQPIIFDIEELKNNGNNFNRKVDDWKPIIPPMHVFCRCHIHEYIDGEIWNDKKKQFEAKHEIVIKNRKPIHFTIEVHGKEKEYFV